MTTVSLLGVEIPVDVEDFITPYWEDVLRFYPLWRERVDWSQTARGSEWSLQAYMLAYANELGRLGKDGFVPNLRERAADLWMARYFEHFGIGHLAQMIELAKR